MSQRSPVSSWQTLVDYPAFRTPLNPEYNTRMKSVGIILNMWGHGRMFFKLWFPNASTNFMFGNFSGARAPSRLNKK